MPALTIDHVWAIAAIVVPTALELMGRMHTVDLAYHLRAGSQFLSGGGVPRVDSFTFTVAGQGWLDQQWGAQVLLTLVHRAGGWAGLVLLLGVLTAATFFFLRLACRARGASPRAASLLTLAAFGVSFLNLSTRPQTLAFPLLTASLWIVAGRRKHPARLWLLPAIAALWSNLHGSFVLAPVVAGMAWIEDRRGSRHATPAGGVAIGTLLATLLNPFGIGAWRYTVGLATHPTILSDIAEWSPPSLRTVTGALFLVSGIAVAGYLARRREPTAWTDLVWLGGSFLLGLSSLRMAIWWGFVATVVVAGMLGVAPREEPSRAGSSVVNALLAATLVALVSVQLPWWRDGTDRTSGASVLLLEAPQHLANATRDSLPAGSRLFVTEYWASWFEFSVPSMPVFVDSRIELFPAGVWNGYLGVISGEATWSSVLDRWQVDGVVLRNEESALQRLIERDPGWLLAYRDRMGALFVRA